MNFLEELYDQGYSPSSDLQPDSEDYQEAKQKVSELGDKVLACIGPENTDLFEDFLSAKAEQFSFELATVYAEGAKFAGKFFMTCFNK